VYGQDWEGGGLLGGLQLAAPFVLQKILYARQKHFNPFKEIYP
jgi:hypothetical protein